MYCYLLIPHSELHHDVKTRQTDNKVKEGVTVLDSSQLIMYHLLSTTVSQLWF